MMKTFEMLNDETLDRVAGGMTREMQAAYDVMEGKYGNGEARIAALRRAGLDPNKVQRLVNGLCWDYEPVARDVINGRYGNGEARYAALRRAGYDAQLVQDIVNGILLD